MREKIVKENIEKEREVEAEVEAGSISEINIEKNPIDIEVEMKELKENIKK